MSSDALNPLSYLVLALVGRGGGGRTIWSR